MLDRKFIFLAGLHRSGTSLLHRILRNHPSISGFSDTGVPEDEGQHLQSVYEPAIAFGGPGKFVFDKRSYMNESHPLATNESAAAIFEQWSSFFDLSCDYLIEKSPPNIVRTRFLQKLFPNSNFIVILRHPLAIAYATQKWSETQISSLLEHTLLGYEIFFKDIEYLRSVYILRYESFVAEPQKDVNNILRYLGLSPAKIDYDVRSNINEKYFLKWEKDRKKLLNRIFMKMPKNYEIRANKFGYSIVNYNSLLPVPWLGAHNELRPNLSDFGSSG